MAFFQLPQLAPRNGTIIPRYALLLNNLLEAVAVESPASLNLTIFNVELLSSLGRFEFSPDLLELLAQQIKSGLPDGYELGSSSHPAEPYVMMFGSMGHLICGFLDEDLTKVLFIQGGISKQFDVMLTSSLFQFFYDFHPGRGRIPPADLRLSSASVREPRRPRNHGDQGGRGLRVGRLVETLTH